MRAAALALALAAGPAFAEDAPSFDCARAASSAEEAVCADAQLAALDRELARLYALAVDGPHMSEDRRRELVAYQRGWVKGRDECWKAEDLGHCVRDHYALRIAELREGHADARAEDGVGVSRGPLALACEGFDAWISVGYVSVDPPLATLRWRDRGVALEAVPVASGARYEGRDFEGAWSLRAKGDEAMFEGPGVDEPLTCRFEETG